MSADSWAGYLRWYNRGRWDAERDFRWTEEAGDYRL